jgi:glucokinase
VSGEALCGGAVVKIKKLLLAVNFRNTFVKKMNKKVTRKRIPGDFTKCAVLFARKLVTKLMNVTRTPI